MAMISHFYLHCTLWLQKLLSDSLHIYTSIISSENIYKGVLKKGKDTDYYLSKWLFIRKEICKTRMTKFVLRINIKVARIHWR